jgi:hypothetical protein
MTFMEIIRLYCSMLMVLEFSGPFFEKYSDINLINIRPAAAELFREDRRTYGWTDRYGEANIRFSQFCERP